MADVIRKKLKTEEEKPASKASAENNLDIENASSDIEIYAKEVLNALVADNLPPTPNNFSLYFDRLIENKSEYLRKQIYSILELEENNDDENSIILEQNLKQGFGSIKNILGVTANLYKNMSLMMKILEKRKKELKNTKDLQIVLNTIGILEGDFSKLNAILKTQNSKIKTIYDNTAKIIKNVENETIFDNKYGVYNKRYLLTKIKQEIELIKEFHHKSSLIMIELSEELKKRVNSNKVIVLMTRTIARLLLKTSRRSDIVAHYGNGVFAMLLKHTDIESAKKASERVVDLVSNSNFFLADREIPLKISIGVTDIDSEHSVEEIVVSAMDGIQKAYKEEHDYAVSLRS